jgi:hypothetical protein
LDVICTHSRTKPLACNSSAALACAKTSKAPATMVRILHLLKQQAIDDVLIA